MLQTFFHAGCVGLPGLIGSAIAQRLGERNQFRFGVGDYHPFVELLEHRGVVAGVAGDDDPARVQPVLLDQEPYRLSLSFSFLFISRFDNLMH